MNKYPYWNNPIVRSICMSVLVFVLCTVPTNSLSADSLSVTVTPPLFQLTIGPGDAWASTLKIVNSNPYDVTFYAQVVDMQPNGEDGRSTFTPIVKDSNDPALQSSSLARWIRVSSDPIFVKAGTSQDLQFNVDIPQNAEPGGHYAAILVGTQPGGIHATGTALKVSSYVSSLLLVRIKGDIVESGRIREFLTSQQLYQTPKADFSLRFENTGNTHVLPRGNITIYNMWGKERGSVAINQDTDFGNVLPKSIRHFEFSWEGEQSLFDIGLYSALVTLSYGENGKQNVSAKTYFWVVPLVPVSIGIGCLVLFIFTLIWFIRRYIRRALMLEQQRLGVYAAPQVQVQAPAPTIAKTLMQPIREGVIDLRSVASKKNASVLAAVAATSETPSTAGQFLRKYKLFGLFLIVLVVGIVGVWLYFSKVLVVSRGFQIKDVHIQEEVPATTTVQR